MLSLIPALIVPCLLCDAYFILKFMLSHYLFVSHTDSKSLILLSALSNTLKKQPKEFTVSNGRQLARTVRLVKETQIYCWLVLTSSDLGTCRCDVI